MKLQERGEKTADNQFEKERLRKDIEVWKEKVLEAEEKCRAVVA